MRSLIVLCAVLAMVPSAAGAAAKPADKVPVALADADRNVAGGRSVRLGIEQNRIETTIDLGRVAATPSDGGLIGAIIIGEKDADRRRLMRGALRDKAEATVRPLREALTGFDVDALALATTKAALARADWFQALEITASREPYNLATFVASRPTAQSAFIDYRYEVSADFSQVRVIADIALARKPPAGKSASPSQILYRQRIASIVQLAMRSYENDRNVASWSADGGKRARAGLTAAFGQLEQLIPYALGLSQAEISAFTAKKREKAFAGGFYGPLIARGQDKPNGILIWADAFVHVQDIP